jgi:hypothetical protein
VRVTADAGVRSKARRLALGLLAAAPPLAALVVITRLRVNVPWGDDWDLIPAVLRAMNGRLEWTDLWSQHNEHRMVLVKVIVIALAGLNRFDLRAELWVGFVMTVATLLLLRHLLVGTLGRDRGEALTVMSSLCLFSTVFFEQWLWPIVAVQWTLQLLTLVSLAWILARWPGQWRGLLLGLAVAMAGSLAVAAGVAVTGVPILTAIATSLATGRRLPAGQLLVGVAVPIAFGAIYVHDLAVARSETTLADGVAFWFAYLGSPLGFARPHLCAAIGVLGILLLAAGGAAAAARDFRRALPWLVLAAEAIVVASVTVLGRGFNGSAGAMVSRYAMVAALLWVAVAALISLAVADPAPAWWRRAALVVAGLAAVAYASAYARGLNRALIFTRAQSVGRTAVLSYETAPDDVLQTAYPPSPAVLRRYARALEARRLGPFADRPPGARASAPRSDEPLVHAAPWGYEGIVENADCNEVSGWAWYPLAEAPLGVEIYDGEKVLGTTRANLYRPDLRKAGKGDGAHAYSYRVGARLADGGPHLIRVRIAGVRGDLPRFGRGGAMVCPLP